MLNLIPLTLFLVSYYYYGMMTATKALMFSSVVIYLYEWYKKGQLKPSEHLTNWFLVLMCTFTLMSNDPIFLVWKASIMYLVMPIGFFIYKKLYNTSVFESLLKEHMPSSNYPWYKIEYALGSVCLFLSTVSFYIYHQFGEQSWVQFKLFALILMSATLFAFIYDIQKYISRHESI
ncbi:septation protein IspZ [Gammaproteobacteria bacterium]|nr:septation protein IspZ [Gammaproteobacteria bacterium]